MRSIVMNEGRKKKRDRQPSPHRGASQRFGLLEKLRELRTARDPGPREMYSSNVHMNWHVISGGPRLPAAHPRTQRTSNPVVFNCGCTWGLLKILMPRPHSRPVKSRVFGTGPASAVFKEPRWAHYAAAGENHCSNLNRCIPVVPILSSLAWETSRSIHTWSLALGLYSWSGWSCPGHSNVHPGLGATGLRRPHSKFLSKLIPQEVSPLEILILFLLSDDVNVPLLQELWR